MNRMPAPPPFRTGSKFHSEIYLKLYFVVVIPSAYLKSGVLFNLLMLLYSGVVHKPVVHSSSSGVLSAFVCSGICRPRRSLSNSQLQMVVGPVVAAVVMYAFQTFITSGVNKRVFREWSRQSSMRFLVYGLLMYRAISAIWKDILSDCIDDFI
jgi:hypothetical protein